MRRSSGVRRRSRLAVLIAVAAVAMSICATAPTAAEPASTAQPTGTSFTGTVTDSSGKPLAGVTVQLYVNLVGATLSTTTAADGTYTFSDLSTAFVYSVGFVDGGYVSQWWNNKPSAATADPVPLTDGQTTAGIDAVLQRETATGSITGHVTDASSPVPLFDATVTATNSATGQSTSVSDLFDGSYTLTGLAPGTYTVEFSAATYIDQWWNNKPSLATADPITVTAGQVVTGIDAALMTGVAGTSGISGQVTDNTGQPIAGAGVVATCAVSGGGVTITAADGTYTIGGLAAPPAGDTCTVFFSAYGYNGQWWDNEPSAPGDPVSVSAGQTTTGINAVLQPVSATLSGFVEGNSGASPAPLAGATVVVHNYYGFTVAQTTTAADGTWSMSNLGGGVYRVEFQPPAGSGLLGQWWNNEPDGAHSDPVGAALGATAGNINANLTAGATVSGTVTNTAGPVAGATVGVFTVNSSNAPSMEVAHTTTAADGTYGVSGLQAGSYEVLFDPPAGSADGGQWYNDSTTAGGATQVTVSTSSTATANAQLATGQRGSISGTVKDESGNPIAGSTVLAVAADGRTTTTATTAADGSYTVPDLDVGIDTVWFLPPAGSSYGASVWNLAVGKVLPITFDQGAAITGINATLSQNGT